MATLQQKVILTIFRLKRQPVNAENDEISQLKERLLVASEHKTLK